MDRKKKLKEELRKLDNFIAYLDSIQDKKGKKGYAKKRKTDTST